MEQRKIIESWVQLSPGESAGQYAGSRTKDFNKPVVSNRELAKNVDFLTSTHKNKS